MAARIKITLNDGTFQAIEVAEDYKLGDAVLTLQHPGQWVLIEHTKGQFAARAGEVAALYLERDGDSG